MRPTCPSSPPTRSSIRSPSIVCVSIIARSVVVERAGLVDDLGRDRGSSRRRGGARRTRRRDARSRRQPSSSATASTRSTTCTAVAAGVRVVGLDDVAEQERGAAVRVAELERVVDATAPLVPEVVGGVRRAAGRGTGRAQVVARCEREQRARAVRALRRPRTRSSTNRATVRTETSLAVFPTTARREVERELCGQCDDVERPRAPAEGQAVRERDHEHRAECVRGVRDSRQELRRRPVAASGRSAIDATGSPAATSAGTSPSGSRKSIGTSTSCVGIAYPVPTSNSTRETSA